MRKTCVFLALAALLLSAGACGGSGAPDKVTNIPGKTEEPDMDAENKELSIYTIDYDTYECKPSISIIPADSTVDAALIVGEVVANFKEDVSIYDIEESEGGVTVSFFKDAAPVKNVSKQMETCMLDCIAYSLLDNLDYCENVYFMCGKDNYSSGNIELAYDEPYISK